MSGFQKDSVFPGCTAAGKKKIVTEHIIGLSIPKLAIKGSGAHARSLLSSDLSHKKDVNKQNKLGPANETKQASSRPNAFFIGPK